MSEPQSSPSPAPDTRKRWRDHLAKHKETPDTDTQPLHIGLAGSFTLDPLVPYLGGQLLTKNFPENIAPHMHIAPYNQIHQLCFNPQQSFEDHSFKDESDILVILWRLEDIVHDLTNFEQACEEINKLAGSMKTLQKNFHGTLIVANPPYPSLPTFDPSDLNQTQTAGSLYAKLSSLWQEAIAAIPGIKTINLDALLSYYGHKDAQDPRKWYLYKQPYTEGFWAEIGTQLARIIAAQKCASKKCLVLDCDNTLWGGIVGEDGLGGIDLGSDFPGSAFQNFQKHLLHFRSKGIFLAVASKNNLDDVLEVFETHDAMILKKDHIAAFEVHWNSKVESLQNIAKALNIGTDALVFVDDNPKEIAEVRERLPEVTCLLIPEEPADIPSLLVGTDLFDIAELTEEDQKRADMMAAESNRSQAQTGLSEEDFLKSLELKITVFEAEDKHLGRITQLINKTNQFNLTTVRRTQEEVSALLQDPKALVMGMQIEDRFGEYGLVGVCIAQEDKNSTWTLDTLLMSCRVLGRGAETSFLAKIAAAVESKGAKTLQGQYIETKKNALVKDLYKDHGFQECGENWVIEAKDIPQPPDYEDIYLRLHE